MWMCGCSNSNGNVLGDKLCLANLDPLPTKVSVVYCCIQPHKIMNETAPIRALLGSGVATSGKKQSTKPKEGAHYEDAVLNLLRDGTIVDRKPSVVRDLPQLKDFDITACTKNLKIASAIKWYNDESK